MAGMRAVEELLSRAPARFDITVIGAEPHPNYTRILLSSVLAGDKTANVCLWPKADFQNALTNVRYWG
jgi:nitrite reductase (NADH) large subunit